MNPESHERARVLLRTACIEGISTNEHRWLDDHLADCVECSNEASALTAAIDSLRTVSVSAPDVLVHRTSRAVHRLAEQHRLKREPTVFLCLAAVMASMWAILTTPFAWSAFAWLGRLLDVSEATWQIGFLVWWFLPVTVLAAVAAWHHSAGRNSREWATGPNWRSL